MEDLLLVLWAHGRVGSQLLLAWEWGLPPEGRAEGPRGKWGEVHSSRPTDSGKAGAPQLGMGVGVSPGSTHHTVEADENIAGRVSALKNKLKNNSLFCRR